MKENKFVLGTFKRQVHCVALPKEEWLTHPSGLLPYEIKQLIAA